MSTPTIHRGADDLEQELVTEVTEETELAHLKLGELLGEGGMGKVFAAVDQKLKRDVAVKVLRRRGQEDHRRLLGEARMLSRLDHPHVCRVYDVVEADDAGEPVSLLVMERVVGRTLAELPPTELSFAERLRVAEQIADALQAAHAQGVVHRDLKPGNVMLSDSGDVKVLDFGLARPVVARGLEGGEADDESGALVQAEAEDWTDAASEPHPTYWKSVATGSGGGVVGTPAYMSPEQARGERASGASDVFSFGLLLHELFSGSSPYGEQANSPRLTLIVAEGKIRPLVGVEPDLADLVQRMKSTTPAARPSSHEVLSELRRIADKPRRRRRRWIAAAVVILLACAVVVHTIDLQQERNLALAARDEAEAVTELMLDVFSAPNPLTAEWETKAPLWQGGDEPVTARQVLDRGMATVERNMSERPEIRAHLLVAIGQAYGGIGEFDRGIALIQQAATSLLGRPDSRSDLAAARQALGNVATTANQFDVAEAAYSEALSLYRMLGDEEGEAVSLLGIAYIRSIFKPEPEVEPLLREALDLLQQHRSPGDLRVLSARHALGWHALIRGDADLALEEFSAAVAGLEGTVPELHPAYASALHGLGEALRKLERLDEAEDALRRALRIAEQVLGTRHRRVATGLRSLAGVLRRQGRYAEAEPFVLRALEITETAEGPTSSPTAASLASLTTLQKSIGRFEEAEASARRSLEIYLSLHEPDSYPALIGEYNLACALRLLARLDEAGERLRRVIEEGTAALGDDASLVVSAHAELAKVLLDQDRPAEAEQEILRALGGEPNGDESDSPAGDLLAILGASRARLGRTDEGRRLLEEAAEGLLEEIGPAPFRTRETLRLLLDLYSSLGEEESPQARRMRTRLAEGEAMALGDGQEEAAS